MIVWTLMEIDFVENLWIHDGFVNLANAAFHRSGKPEDWDQLKVTQRYPLARLPR